MAGARRIDVRQPRVVVSGESDVGRVEAEPAVDGFEGLRGDQLIGTSGDGVLVRIDRMCCAHEARLMMALATMSRKTSMARSMSGQHSAGV